MPYPPVSSAFALPQQAQPPLPPPVPTSRCLNVKNGGLSRPQILITDSLTSMPLYTFTFPKRSHLSSEPHISVTGPSGAPVATIHFHSMSNDIDLVIHGQAVAFKTNGITAGHGMVSHVPGVGKLKWKNKRGGEIKCKDEKGEVIARLEVGTWGKVKKEAQFEVGSGVTGGAVMDEIVVSGISMVENRRRKNGGSELAQAGADVAGALGGAGA
ncbi:MAG: hypothetical protein Q9195_004003 [Heterodermia aff. obscurata]